MDSNNVPEIVNFSEMARNVGMSRARLYELVEKGIVPEPMYNLIQGRPVYTKKQQILIKQIFQSRVGANGQPFMVYAKRTQKKKEEKITPRIARLDVEKISKAYQITPKNTEEMFVEQNGSCAICGTSKGTLCVDHCHTTGKVRGMLCGACNKGIGMFYDNVLFLKNAIAYLEIASQMGVLNERKT